MDNEYISKRELLKNLKDEFMSGLEKVSDLDETKNEWSEFRTGISFGLFLAVNAVQSVVDIITIDKTILSNPNDAKNLYNTLNCSEIPNS